MGDINGLKYINDNFGYAEGDKILRIVEDIFRKCCAYDDIAARCEGKHFDPEMVEVFINMYRENALNLDIVAC